MDIEKEVAALMQKNQRVVLGNFFTVPSPERYPFQWLWDSCFHSHIYTALGETETAKRELLSVVRKQHQSGMIPHITFWHPPGTKLPDWGREHRGNDLNQVFGVTGTSSLTQPPVIARAVLDLFKETNDQAFVAEMFTSLTNYFDYLHRERTLRYSSLLYIINPDESGEDNARRFDLPLQLTAETSIDQHLTTRIALMEQLAACDFNTKTCMRQHFAVIDVAFNAIYSDGLEALAELAQVMKKPALAKKYQRRQRKLQREMKKQLSEDGVHFYAKDIRNKLNLKTLDWNIFMPLYAGLVSREGAAELVQLLMDDKLFWAEHGVRTLPKNNLAYIAGNGFWRGPIWLVPHYFIYQGLLRYGYREEATLLKQKSLSLIEQFGFREHYNGETGAGHGAHDFTWSALVLAMN